ncbi:MAG: 2-C-methyl-D-erythritol 2,4-cyclodiphosphate synthase [Caldiserica bacterium]|nr:2-C-methyl-D-erythritol 2,4-cyclodiphosphate synthase [Caldisericota bacterium]
MELRVGIGIDIHPWERGRDFYLGGVKIPYPLGLAGHSDGDVLIHALMDALLGSLGLGDIGEYFPPSKEELRGISSVKLLREVMQKVRESKGEVVNVDAVVMMEEPMLLDYKRSIKEVLCRELGISSSRVNIKATTCEGLGFVGRKEGVVSVVTVMVRKDD